MYSQHRADYLTVSRPGQRSGVVNAAANHGFAAVQCAPGDGNAAPFRPFSQIANISQSGSRQQALAGSLHAPMPRAPSASQGSNNNSTQQPHQSQQQNRKQQHNMGGVLGFTSTSGASGLPQALVRPFSAGSRPMGHNASITAGARPISAPSQPMQLKSQLASRPMFASLSMRPALGSGGTGTGVTGNTGCAAGLSATAATVTAAVVNLNGYINMSQKSDDRDLYHAGFSASQGSAGMSYNDCVQFRAGAANRSRGAAWPSAQGSGGGGGGVSGGGDGGDGGVVPNIRISRTSSGATNGPRPTSANATQRHDQHRPYSAPNYYEPDVEPYDKSAALENYAAARESQQQHGSVLLTASQVEEPLLPFPLASGSAGSGLGVTGLAQEIQLRKRQDAGALATAAAVASKVPGDSGPQQMAIHQSENCTLPARLDAHHKQVISEPHVGQVMASCELLLNGQAVQESGSSAAAAVPLPSIAPPGTNTRCAAETAATSQECQGGYATADFRCGDGQGLAPGLSQQEPRLWSQREQRQDQAPQLHQQGRLLSRSDEQQLPLPLCDQEPDDDHQREERRRQQDQQRSNKLQNPNQQQTGQHCHRSRQLEERYHLSQVTEEVQQPTPAGATPQQLPSPPHPALRRLHQQLDSQELCQQQEQRLAVLVSSQEPHQHQQLQVLRRNLEESQSQQELTRGDATKESDCRVVTQMRKGSQPHQETEGQCLLVRDPAHQHRLQPQRRQEQKAPAETDAAPHGFGPSAHGAMLETCYSELHGTLNCIAARTAKVEEAMQVCQQIAASLPEVMSLLHHQNAVLQGLRTAQEDAAVAAATATAAMERRFAQALLRDEGQRRLGGGGGVDATAQTSPSFTLLPPDPGASGLRLTGSGAPEPRALFQGPPDGGGISGGPGVAVGAGMANSHGAVAGVGGVSVCAGIADGGNERPRCRRSVGTHRQLTTTTTTTTTTTVYEEEEEEQQPVGNNREEGDEEKKQGSEGQAVRSRLEGPCHTPASKGNGPGTARRVRSVIRVQQTHTQHHCSVLEHELFPEEYTGEALLCEGLRRPPPSPQSPLSEQQQQRCFQTTRDGDAQPAPKGGATGWGEPSLCRPRQPPQRHLQESCKQAHLLRQPPQQLPTETQPRQKERAKQQNQDPLPKKRHRTEEGRMAEIVRPPDIQAGAKSDAQG
ncbi:hypothetical protein VaNZ11_014369, partial [Volvox africanus]